MSLCWAAVVLLYVDVNGIQSSFKEEDRGKEKREVLAMLAGA